MAPTGILAKLKALFMGGSETDEDGCCCGMEIEEKSIDAGRGD